MIRKELRIYKTRKLADVAMMQFYGDNKSNIKMVSPSHNCRTITMIDGTKITFKGPEAIVEGKVFNNITFY